MDENENDIALERIKSASMALGEHFDTIQIVATRHNGESDTSALFKYGIGNWFARFGSVCEWVEREREKMRVEERSQE